MKRILATLLFVVALAASSLAGTQGADQRAAGEKPAPGAIADWPAARFVIKPGRGFGPIKLGMAREAVHRLLGPPANPEDEGTCGGGDVWQDAGTRSGVQVVYYDGVVAGIRIAGDTRFHTTFGLTTGYSRDDVWAFLPRAQITTYSCGDDESSLYGMEVIEDSRQGIAYIVFHDPDGAEFHEITIFRRGMRYTDVFLDEEADEDNCVIDSLRE